ncbi:MAG: hypothetical protein FJX71_02190 [Alphaproteobacteria bacterium]|nr:hypothetical protein [Alphaproteobacteria bacterium]
MSKVLPFLFASFLNSVATHSADLKNVEDAASASSLVTAKLITTRTRIDMHVTNPELNLQEMRNKIEKVLQDDPYYKPLHPFFDRCRAFTALSNLATLVELAALSEDQRAIVNIYTRIVLNRTKAGSVYTHIRKLGILCSLFLSPKSLNTVAVETMCADKYPLICNAGKKAKKYLLTPEETTASADKKKKLKEMNARLRAMSGFEDTSEKEGVFENHLYPLVLLESSTFDKEDFFYALSKGIVLFGLQKNYFPGHGRVFESPYLAWCHDEGHFSTLCKGAAGETPEHLNRHALVLSYISARILELASLYTQKGEALRHGLVIDTGFNVIHESNLPKQEIVKSTTSRFFQAAPPLSFESTAENYLTFVLTAAIKGDMGFNEFEEIDSIEFAYRFLSDLPKELVRRQPVLQDRIKINHDSRRAKGYISVGDYNWEATLSILREQFDWLLKELSAHPYTGTK